MSESEGKPEELEQTQEDRGRGELVAEDKGATKVSIFAIAAGISAVVAFVLLVVLCRCELDLVGLEFAFVFFWLLAGVSGVATIVNITFDSKRLKEFSLAVLAIVVFFSPWLVPRLFRGPPDQLGNVCSATLHQLSLAVKEYADAHDGHLPPADKWCDLLVGDSNSLSGKGFRCLRAKAGTCGYAFNKNLDGLHLYRDVHKHAYVVVVFEADGGWNLSGGEELLRMRHRVMKKKRCNLLFADFSVRTYDEEDFEKRPVRWKP